MKFPHWFIIILAVISFPLTASAQDLVTVVDVSNAKTLNLTNDQLRITSPTPVAFGESSYNSDIDNMTEQELLAFAEKEILEGNLHKKELNAVLKVGGTPCLGFTSKKTQSTKPGAQIYLNHDFR